jgi:hypothetical protein
LLEEGLTLVEEGMQKELAQAPARHKEVIVGVLDTLSETFLAGNMESLIQILPTDDRMFLLGVVNVWDAKPLDAALTELLPVAEKSADVESVRLRVAEVNQIGFHQIQSAHPRPAEELLYGPHPSLYAGAGDYALWVAMGGKATPEHLTEYVHRRCHSADNPEKLVHAHVRLKPWLPLLERSGRTGGHAAAISKALGDAEEDRIAFGLETTPDGLSARLTFDRPYLNVLAAAITGRLQQR